MQLLKKGEQIALKQKDQNTLKQVCVGANWGAIEGRGFFGGKKMIAVDLDLSVGLFDSSHAVQDAVYYSQLKSKCGAVVHSGDDLTGDTDGDDGLDNEIIQIDLSRIPDNITQLVFVLNSFNRQDFKDIPFASVRIYEGTPSQVNTIHARFELNNSPDFAGKISLILAKMQRQGNEWNFHAIGAADTDKNMKQSFQRYVSEHC